MDPITTAVAEIDEQELERRIAEDPIIPRFHAAIEAHKAGEAKRLLQFEAKVRAKYEKIEEHRKSIRKIEREINGERGKIKGLERAKKFRRGPIRLQEKRIATRKRVIRDQMIKKRLIEMREQFRKEWKV